MNPVARKDLLSLLRHRRAGAIQIGFVASLMIVILASWPQGGVFRLGEGGQDQLLCGVVLAQLLLICLVVPGLAAPGLTSERESQTLELLYASRITPMEFLIGKVIAAIGFPILLLVSGLPFAAMLLWRGGVQLSTLALSYAVLVVTGLMLSILSMAVSACCRQTSTAILLSYLLAMALCGGTLVPAAVMLDSSVTTATPVLHYLRGTSPLAAAMSFLRPSMREDFSGQIHQLLPLWKVYFPVAGLFACFSCALVARRLNQSPTDERREAHPKARKTLAGIRSALLLIDNTKPRRPFGRFNPIAGKERRSTDLRSGSWMIRSFYLALLLSLALAVMSLQGDPEHPDLLARIATILVSFQAVLIALLVPSLTSAAISSELEAGTWDLLRASPMTGWTIFSGKLIASIPSATLPLLAMLPAYGAICYVDRSYAPRLLAILFIMACAVLLCLCIALACSSFLADSSKATVSAHATIAAFFALPLLAWFAAGSHIGEASARWLVLPSPLVISINLLPGGDSLVEDQWKAHLVLSIGCTLASLVIARLQITRLLVKGVS